MLFFFINDRKRAIQAALRVASRNTSVFAALVDGGGVRRQTVGCAAVPQQRWRSAGRDAVPCGQKTVDEVCADAATDTVQRRLVSKK